MGFGTITLIIVIFAFLLVIGWNIFLAYTGRTTISQYMKQLSSKSVIGVAVFCFIIGFIVGLLFGHWWWPV